MRWLIKQRKPLLNRDVFFVHMEEQGQIRLDEKLEARYTTGNACFAEGLRLCRGPNHGLCRGLGPRQRCPRQI